MRGRFGCASLSPTSCSSWPSFQVDADATAAVGSAGATPQADVESDMPVAHNLVLPFTLEPVRPKRYMIRADVHFNTDENIITAMFELPGVKRPDLRITMSVCPFSRVRQVTISGVSRGTLPVQGHQVRERKFGEFFRTLAVPPETKVRRSPPHPPAPYPRRYSRGSLMGVRVRV